MRIGLVFFFTAFWLSLSGQLTERYEGQYADYYNAEDLYEKQQYAAAQKYFRDFADQKQIDKNDPFYVKARYYEVICALELYNNNIEELFNQFLYDYPETIFRTRLYFKMGLYHYQRRKFEETLLAFSQISPFELEGKERIEYYFKKGYAAFTLEDFETARNAFYEVKDSVSVFQEPSIYYYAHISYEKQAYSTALEEFLKIKDSENFKTVVPYYIVQIHHRLKLYDELVKYGSSILKSDLKLHKEDVVAYLVGDAYYQMEKYDEAVPFFEKYAAKNPLTRDESYKMGFAYYKSRIFDKAIFKLQGVGRERDKMGQLAMYHLAEAYIQNKQLDFAKNAFKIASEMSFDADVEEDALFKHALISYQLDYNPYDEAIKAFKLYLKRYPHSEKKPEVYQYMVNVFTTTKNYRAAIESLEEITDKDARLKMAYQIMSFNYGIEMLESKKYKQAIEVFQKVKTYPIDPKLNSLSLYWTADAYYRMVDYPEAIRFYRAFMNERGASALKEHDYALYHIGYSYFNQQDYVSALQAFRSFDQSTEEKDRKMHADALLRAGDCFFLTKEDEQAQNFYQRVIDMKEGYLDYANYQIAISQGYQGQNEEKIKRLLNIVNNFPKSSYLVSSIFGIAETYQKKLNDGSTALTYYNQILTDHPNNIKAKESIFEMGVIYFNAKDYVKAEKMFLRILNEYKDAQLSITAINRLRDVYIALGTPEKYYDLAESTNLASVSEFEKDSTSYEVAYMQYFDSSYVKAIESFSRYLKEFPNGIFKVKAHFYRAVSLEHTEKPDEALLDYEVVARAPLSNFSEGALLKASLMRYRKDEYSTALEYYKKLEESGSYQANIQTAVVGQMRCYHYLKNDTYAVSYADKVLGSALSLDEIKTEAYYVKGLVLKRKMQYEEALDALNECAKKTSGIIGAESKYNVAEIHHLTGDYKASEATIKKLVQEKPSYQFWVAKAFILQGKNLIEMDDLFQAEHTVNSVLSNYKIEDDGILEEANQVMDYIREIKESEKKEKTNIAPTIEVEGDE